MPLEGEGFEGQQHKLTYTGAIWVFYKHGLICRHQFPHFGDCAVPHLWFASAFSHHQQLTYWPPFVTGPLNFMIAVRQQVESQLPLSGSGKGGEVAMVYTTGKTPTQQPTNLPSAPPALQEAHKHQPVPQPQRRYTDIGPSPVVRRRYFFRSPVSDSPISNISEPPPSTIREEDLVIG